MNKRILVIGANSTLAKAIIPALAADYTVVTAGRSGCEVTIDVSKTVTIPDDIDTVIQFAASFGGTGDEEIMAAVDTNTLGTLRVCMAARAAGVRHVINTSSVYAMLAEDSPHYSIYALTKRHGDELAEFYCRQHDIALTVLRPSRIYGDSNDFRKHQPFLYQLIDTAQRGEDISLYGTNDARRNYLHSADLAEIVRRVVAGSIEGTYVCAQPSDSTYGQIAQAAQAVFGQGGRVLQLADKPDIPDDDFTKDDSIYEKIDFRPAITMEAGITRIKAFREDRS